MTNGEKFKEIFGFSPANCVAPAKVCEEMNMKCRECVFDTFWDKEYKSCFRIKEDYEEEYIELETDGYLQYLESGEEGDPHAYDERQKSLLGILKHHQNWIDK